MREFTTGRGMLAAVVVVLLAGSGGTAWATAPEGPVHVPAGATVVPGSYLVTMRHRAGDKAPGAAAAELAARYGGTVRRTYQRALTGFQLAATERQARRLAADPRVALVEADTVVAGTAVREYPLWNLDRIDQRPAVLDDAFTFPDEAGTGVTAYIMDTGIRTSHTEFGGRASVGFDAIADGWNGQDCHTEGHGTHVAGTVGGATFGLAERVRLVSIRVLGCNNLGTISQIVAGVDWVTQNAQRPAVANMSLGGAGRSTALETAVRNSVAAGITYVVAAGNSNTNACDHSPGAVPEAITVGASNSLDERARDWGGAQSGSNFGPCLDLFAPGQEIRSAHNATDRATRVLRGTSMAAPHVAGAAALVLSRYPQATPAQVGQLLIDSATVNTLRADTIGTGSPNRFLYITDTFELPPTVPARSMPHARDPAPSPPVPGAPA